MNINNFQKKQGETERKPSKIRGSAHREDKGHFGGAAAAEIS